MSCIPSRFPRSHGRHAGGHLDIVNFYRSTTSDPRHRDDANDKRGRSPKFEIFVAVEASTATESNDKYPFGEGKLTGDELQQGLSYRV
jgi:hypothetical protein